jgi:DNA-binding transcriptional LysR family regulator
MPGGVYVDTKTDALSPAPATNWDDYRFFLTVARVGNFRRAAQELETTQATVSRRIENLERTLNQKLFDRPRGRGGVVLTFEGRRVLQDVSAAEISLGKAGRLSRVENGIAGDCKILGTDGIANYWMPPFLTLFGAKYPAFS